MLSENSIISSLSKRHCVSVWVFSLKEQLPENHHHCHHHYSFSPFHICLQITRTFNSPIVSTPLLILLRYDQNSKPTSPVLRVHYTYTTVDHQNFQLPIPHYVQFLFHFFLFLWLLLSTNYLIIILCHSYHFIPCVHNSLHHMSKFLVTSCLFQSKVMKL